MTSTPSAIAVEPRPVKPVSRPVAPGRNVSSPPRPKRRQRPGKPTLKISLAFVVAVGLASGLVLVALTQLRGTGLRPKSSPIDLREFR